MHVCVLYTINSIYLYDVVVHPVLSLLHLFRHPSPVWFHPILFT